MVICFLVTNYITTMMLLSVRTGLLYILFAKQPMAIRSFSKEAIFLRKRLSKKVKQNNLHLRYSQVQRIIKQL